MTMHDEFQSDDLIDIIVRLMWNLLQLKWKPTLGQHHLLMNAPMLLVPFIPILLFLFNSSLFYCCCDYYYYYSVLVCSYSHYELLLSYLVL
jgi:hypothetical protein